VSGGLGWPRAVLGREESCAVVGVDQRVEQYAVFPKGTVVQILSIGLDAEWSRLRTENGLVFWARVAHLRSPFLPLDSRASVPERKT
jgi:hypothetical protein